MMNPTNANHINRASCWLSSCQLSTTMTSNANCIRIAKNRAALFR